MTKGRLPVVSGRQLLRWLKTLGYEVVRQRGSHVRLEQRTGHVTHAMTVPYHQEIAKGTLNDILNAVSRTTQQDKSTLIQDLSRFT